MMSYSRPSRHRAATVVGLVTALSLGCTDRRSASNTETTTAITAVSTVAPTTSAAGLLAPDEFCAAAKQAARGHIDFADTAATARLTNFEGLTDHQRSIIDRTVRATSDELARFPNG